MRGAGSQSISQGMTRETWRIVGYVRDAAKIRCVPELDDPPPLTAFVGSLTATLSKKVPTGGSVASSEHSVELRATAIQADLKGTVKHQNRRPAMR